VIVSDPTIAGPNRDGSKSLAPESKVGNVVQWLVTAAGTGLLAALANLDTSHWTGYLGMIAVTVVALISGLLSSYLKKNR
jgi:hypothetical protein